MTQGFTAAGIAYCAFGLGFIVWPLTDRRCSTKLRGNIGALGAVALFWPLILWWSYQDHCKRSHT